MGNALVSISGDGLATAAVAKYMRLTKDQVRQMRTGLREFADSQGTVGRHLFQIAMSRAKIRLALDGRILNLLFSMWDIAGDDRINYHDYIVAIAPLACPGESLTQVLSFCMEIMDYDGSGEISAKQLILMLKNINLMASYFGDCTLNLRQIHKVVDSVFDTITMISNDDSMDFLKHQECVDRLLQESLVQKTAFNKLLCEYNYQSMKSGGFPTTSPSNTATVGPAAPSTTTTTVLAMTPTIVLSPRSSTGAGPLSPHSNIYNSGTYSQSNNCSSGPTPYSKTNSEAGGSSTFFSTSTASPRLLGTGTPHTGSQSTGPDPLSPGGGAASHYTATPRSYYTATPKTNRTLTPIYANSPGAARSTPPIRFFQSENPSPAVSPRQPFTCDTRLEEESLLTDVSSHFLQPLAFKFPGYPAQEDVPSDDEEDDELVSL